MFVVNPDPLVALGAHHLRETFGFLFNELIRFLLISSAISAISKVSGFILASKTWNLLLIMTAFDHFCICRKFWEHRVSFVIQVRRALRSALDETVLERVTCDGEKL